MYKLDFKWQNYAQNFSANNVVLNTVNGWVNAPIAVHGTPLKKLQISHKVLLNNVDKVC